MNFSIFNFRFSKMIEMSLKCVKLVEILMLFGIVKLLFKLYCI